MAGHYPTLDWVSRSYRTQSGRTLGMSRAQKRERRKWVGSGRVALRHVSPIPPLEPCMRLSPHTAHEIGAFMVTSISPGFHQVHGVQLARSLGNLYRFPPLSLRAFAMHVALLGRHRARCLTVRLPMPPVRPVRETFASYGSRQRDIMGKVHFASSTEHSPWTALRVRWVPLYCVPTLSLGAFAVCAAFLRSDYYAQFDCLQGLGVSYGSPHFYSPPSLTSLAGSPVFTTEDSSKTR